MSNLKSNTRGPQARRAQAALARYEAKKAALGRDLDAIPHDSPSFLSDVLSALRKNDIRSTDFERLDRLGNYPNCPPWFGKLRAARNAQAKPNLFDVLDENDARPL